MINRRTFLNTLGAAIIGTAIYLKLPSQIMPILEEPTPVVVENVEPYVTNIWNYKLVKEMRKTGKSWAEVSNKNVL